jgi:long-chain acyl-CoA synthetase
MNTYTDRPWLALYPAGSPTDITPEFDTALAMFEAARDEAPEGPLIQYFDATLTLRDVDNAATALAATLVNEGFSPGDRLALFTQNNPAYVIGMIAAWKAGGAAVAVNPMNRARELTYLLADSGAAAMVVLDDLYEDVAREVIATVPTDIRTVITTSAQDWQTRNDPRLFSGTRRPHPDGTLDLREIIADNTGRTLPSPGLSAADPAVLIYTSGTTGKPKGAVNSHRNLVFNAQVYRDWIGLTRDDTILGIAPLFHVTGLVGHLAVSLLLGAPLVLAHRFQPGVMLDAIREQRPTFTIGAITALSALAAAPGASRDDFRSLRAVYSGGAAVPPTVAETIERQLGCYVHNAYGLTESTSITHLVPPGARAPVDASSGALSIGVPVFSTVVRVLDDDGAAVPVGEVGELAVTGPQVGPGYWNKPEETAEALVDGELRTGDVGLMDADGWFYLVDRKKDMINASGYKVWPREVEDVLYGHPAVREVAVVGVADPYRGETVKAFVSLKPDAAVTGDELIEFARSQMAAYKYPRLVEFVDEIPKNVAGKILRRELRGRSNC